MSLAKLFARIHLGRRGAARITTRTTSAPPVPDLPPEPSNSTISLTPSPSSESPLPLRCEIHAVWAHYKGSGRTHVTEQMATARHPHDVKVLAIDLCTDQGLSRRLLTDAQRDHRDAGSVLSFLASMLEGPWPVDAMHHLVQIEDADRLYCLQAGQMLLACLPEMLVRVQDHIVRMNTQYTSPWLAFHLMLRRFVERLMRETTSSWAVYVDCPTEGPLLDMALASADSIVMPMDGKHPEQLQKTLAYLRINLPYTLPSFLDNMIFVQRPFERSFSRQCRDHGIVLAKVCPVLVGPKANILRLMWPTDPQWVQEQAAEYAEILADPLILPQRGATPPEPKSTVE